jgi:hypothetical protein
MVIPIVGGLCSPERSGPTETLDCSSKHPHNVNGSVFVAHESTADYRFPLASNDEKESKVCPRTTLVN